MQSIKLTLYLNETAGYQLASNAKTMKRANFRKVRLLSFLGFLLFVITGITFISLISPQNTLNLYYSFTAFESFVILLFIVCSSLITKELRDITKSSNDMMTHEYKVILRRIRYTTILCSLGGIITLIALVLSIVDIDYPGRDTNLQEGPLWEFGYSLLFVGIPISASSLTGFGTAHASSNKSSSTSKTTSVRSPHQLAAVDNSMLITTRKDDDHH